MARNRIAEIKRDLKKYCSSVQSIEESKRNFGFAIQEYKKLDLAKGNSDVTVLSEDHSKFITFLHMAILCYVRPFKNSKFALGEKILRGTDRKIHQYLCSYRNCIIAHHENLKEKDFIVDPDDRFNSQFIVKIDPSGLYLSYNMIIPYDLNEIEEYHLHINKVEENLRSEIELFIEYHRSLLQQELKEEGLFTVSNQNQKILERKEDTRFNRNTDGNLTVVPKYLNKIKT
jgi:hypothetical protein